MDYLKGDILHVPCNNESEFLYQIKKCQNHLARIEKLFLDSQKRLGEKQVKSYTSLNSKLSKSLPDIQLLMQDCKNKFNLKSDLFKKNCYENLLSETPENAEENSRDINKKQTFVIQVPNTILDALKEEKSMTEFLSQTQLAENSKRKKILAWFLQKCFRKKKRDLSKTANIEICQGLLQFFKLINKGTVCKKFTNTEKAENTKESQTKINIEKKSNEGKSCTSINPNLFIEHDVVPQINSNTFTYSIKIRSDLPSKSMYKLVEAEEEIIKNQKNETQKDKEYQTTEILLNNLIKTLLNTSKKLDNLELIKILLERLYNETSESKNESKISNDSNKSSKKIKILNHILHTMPNFEKKNTETKSSTNDTPQILKRQLSKLSICSSIHSTSSKEELNKYTIVGTKKAPSKKLSRLSSPSRLNYRVCPSARDIDPYYYY